MDTQAQEATMPRFTVESIGSGYFHAIIDNRNGKLPVPRTRARNVPALRDMATRWNAGLPYGGQEPPE